MPSFEFTSPEGKKYNVEGPEGATAGEAWDVLKAQEFAAEKGMKFEPITKTRGEYIAEIPGNVAEALRPMTSGAPSDKAREDFRRWQEDQLKSTGYAPFAPWENRGNPVLGAAEIGSLLPFGGAGAGAKALATGATKMLPAMAKAAPGFWRGAGSASRMAADAGEGAGLKAIRRLVEEGKTVPEIAATLGASERQISNVMRENRIELKNRGDDMRAIKGREDWDARIKYMHERGFSDPFIAKELGGGITPTAVWNRRLAMRLREDAESAEGMGVVPKVSEWETDPVTGVRSRRIGGDTMQREVLERGRSGRPVKTESLPQKDEEILQQGFDKNAVFAYHASPHDFEQFDLSHMGTGQGAQSYGPGHYLAESPEVSGRGGAYDQEFSSKLLRDLSPPQRIAGHMLTNTLVGNTPETANQYAKAALTATMGDRQKAITNLETDVSFYDKSVQGRGRPKAMTDAIELLKSDWQPSAYDREAAYRDAVDAARTYQGAPRGKDYVEAAELIKSGWEPPKAKIYETVIKAPQEKFLDWDKPLSEQVPEVLEVLERSGLLSELKSINAEKDSNVEHLISSLKRGYQDDSPMRSAEEVNALFGKAGIPGIKYLDQMSREKFSTVTARTKEEAEEYAQQFRSRGLSDVTVTQTENGWQAKGRPKRTRNYVVFDDKTIDVLKKYGIAGPLGAGGAAAALRPDSDQ